MADSDKAVIEKLRDECDTMRSRVEAILTCEAAIECLEAEDVFGKNFGELLFSDVRALSEAIKTADAALRLKEAST